MSIYTDAQTDAAALSKLVNEDTDVNTRYGTNPKKSGPKAIREFEEKGNLALKNSNFTDAGFDFAAGGTIETYNQLVKDASGNSWQWQGDLPHVVAAGTDPTISADWKQRTFNEIANISGLRDELDDRALYLTLSEAQAKTDLSAGQYVRLTDRGGLWQVTTDAPNTWSILDIGDSLALKLQIGLVIDPVNFGLSEGNTAAQNTAVLQHIADTVDHAIIQTSLDVELEKTFGQSYCVLFSGKSLQFKGNGSLSCNDSTAQILRFENMVSLYYDGWDVVGSGTNGSNQGFGLIQVVDGSNLTFENFSVKDSSCDGIAIAQANTVRVTNVKADNCSKAGVYLTECTNGRVNSVSATNCGGHLVGGLPVGVGVQISGCTDVVVDKASVDDVTGIGVFVNHTGSSKPYLCGVTNSNIQTVANPTNTSVEGGIVFQNGSGDKHTSCYSFGNTCTSVRDRSYYIENHNGFQSNNDKAQLAGRSSLIVSSCEDFLAEDFAAYNGGQTVNVNDIILINTTNNARIIRPEMKDIPEYPAGTSFKVIQDDSTGSNYSEYAPVMFRTTWEAGALTAGQTVTHDIPSTALDVNQATWQVIAPFNLNGCIASIYSVNSGTARLSLYNASGASRTFPSANWQLIATRRLFTGA